ncbi:hypothetical protein DFH06DRAFT_1329210 [Mycena polygramma]|nr:hypothetical protein DFH06DRAFT_1329210 [Mycena polygramma]
MAHAPSVRPQLPSPARLPYSCTFKDTYIEKIVRMYPWGQQPVLNPTLLMGPGCRTLRDNGFLLLWFSPNPADCTRCLKPILRHPSLPGFAFTILTSCQHGVGENASEELFPNKSVAGVMPFEYRAATCLGNLVVVKHPCETSPTVPVSNADLPIVDVEPADHPFIDELVRRWCYRIHNLANSATAQ